LPQKRKIIEGGQKWVSGIDNGRKLVAVESKRGTGRFNHGDVGEKEGSATKVQGTLGARRGTDDEGGRQRPRKKTPGGEVRRKVGKQEKVENGDKGGGGCRGWGKKRKEVQGKNERGPLDFLGIGDVG